MKNGPAIGFRVDPETMALIERLAAAEDLTISALVRLIVAQGLKRRLREKGWTSPTSSAAVPE